MNFPFRIKKARLSEGGSTLVEAMMACLIVALFFASIYAGGWRSLHALKSAMEGSTASQMLMTLQEQMRMTTWSNLTTSTTTLSGEAFTSYSSNVNNPTTSPLGHLPNVTQTVVVNPYPVPGGYNTAISGTSVLGGSQTLAVSCSSNGTITSILTGNGGLSAQNAVRVDIVLSWTTSFSSTPHTRMVSMIVSQGGVLGQN